MGLHVNAKEAKWNDKGTKPEVTVIIPTYNRSEILRGALESLICQETDSKFSYEIVVVDNASTDSTKAVVQQFASTSPVPIKYILEEDNGVAQARNRGVKESKTRWIAFIDDDELAEEDWLKELYEVILKTGAQCVGGLVKLDLPIEQLRKLGRVRREALRERIGYGNEVRKSPDGERPGTDNMLVARSVFDAIGFFDYTMLTGGSDYDFTIRVQRAGFDIWYTPKAIVCHRVSQKRLTPKSFKVNAMQGGSLLAYFDYKYKGCGKMLYLLIARIGQALIINLPRLFFVLVRFDNSKILERNIPLWRFMGYMQRALTLIAPRIFSEEKFLDKLNFRKSRTLT